MKLIPAADDASRDPELRGRPLAIYRYLLDMLDPRDWHEVKLIALCAELDIGKTVAGEAMALLVARGYLEADRRARVGTGQPRQYRLNFRRQIPPTPLDSRSPAA